ncbi:hypothetical protein BKM17_06485 [Pseudomonas syringae group genomosp. 3]|nr:hypothetical protein BKM17_06485 [Pseudomonas syringae group genomosp. 3]
MRYAEFERDRASSALVAKTITFRYVAEKYVVDVVPTKALATQKDNKRELANLMDLFDDPPGPLDLITPQNVRQRALQYAQTAKRLCSATSGTTPEKWATPHWRPPVPALKVIGKAEGMSA